MNRSIQRARVQEQQSSSPEKSSPNSRHAEEGIRVFHMVNTLDVGGTESQMAQVACHLSRNRYRVSVGCVRMQGPLLDVLQQAGIPIAAFSPGGTLISLSGLWQLVRLAWFIRRERFHLVHAHDLWSNLLAVPAAWLARTPVIISSRRDLGHMSWYTPWRTKILRLIQRRSTCVLVNSAAVREFLVKQNGFPSSNIQVIHNAVDFERFATASGHRAKLFPGLHGDHKVVAVIANMHSLVKGHTDLIEAARTVCGELPTTRFVLVGDGIERPRFEQKARELGLQEHFLFLGHRSDVPELLTCCDLSVLPSRAEGFPNAILESMAAGVPVVATRVGGNTEVIHPEATGLLVPPRDPEALAQAILYVLRDKEFASGLARRAQEQVRLRFSFGRLLSELDALYHDLLSRKGVVPAKLDAAHL